MNKTNFLVGNLYQLFENQVNTNPNNIAIIYEGKQFTYSQINQQVDNVAKYLLTLNLNAGDYIGIALNKSEWLIIGILSILKIGAIYVPIDPVNPLNRIEFIIDDSKLSKILTQKSLLNSNLFGSIPLVAIDDLNIDGLPCEELLTNYSSSGSAYVIYTSGTTGKPNGVVVSHKNVLNLLQSTQNLFDFNKQDIWLLAHSTAFDFSVWEIWGAFAYGGKLVIPSDWTLRDPNDFEEIIIREKITVLNQTPSVFKQVLSIKSLSNANQKLSLRYIIFGGEALIPSEISEWFTYAENHNIDLVNMYGITETTVHATYKKLSFKDQTNNSPIGTPLPSYNIHILDSQLKEVKIGEIGEMFISGDGLTKGYLNNDELTKERFIKIYLKDKSESSDLYRTGDLAIKTLEGELIFCGRKDEQIKFNGYRIETGEINTALKSFGNISTAVTKVLELNKGQKVLISYIVSDSDNKSELSEKVIRKYLEECLPKYMLPSKIFTLDKIPVTNNGKIDNEALRIIALANKKSEIGSLELPFEVNEIDKRFLEICQNLLELPTLDLKDNFFDLGGHSLLAMQLIVRAQEIYNLKLDIRDIFTKSFLEILAWVHAHNRKEGSLPEFTDTKNTDYKFSSLSFSQNRLWYLYQIEGANPTYNVPFSFKIDGLLDINILTKSINHIVERHNILRTVFKRIENMPVQIIKEKLIIEFPIQEIWAIDYARAVDDIVKLTKKEGMFCFDLEEGPLLRGKIFKLSATSHVLFINFHHIVFDGWSLGLFLKELKLNYEAILNNKDANLPELESQYADFSNWQLQQSKNPLMEEQRQYWKKQLAHIPPLLNLPLKGTRPAIQSYHGDTLTFKISPELSRKITLLGHSQGATLFMTMLAGFYTLLYRYTNQRDIAVGFPVANRTQKSFEQNIGFFVNTLVMYTEIDPEQEFIKFLNKIKVLVLDAYAHQDLPFDQVVEMLNPERSPSYSPLFQVLFVMQSTSLEGMNVADLAFRPLRTSQQDHGTAKFDLMLDIETWEGGLKCEWVYNTSLLNRSTVEDMAQSYILLLEKIIDSSITSLNKLSLMSENQVNKLFNAVQNIDYSLDNAKCIHSLVEEQVKLSPNAIAVTFEDKELSYDELNNRANQLAHKLIKLGVGPEVRVGLYMNRSIEMPIAVLGVLKSGGAYVGLDPAYSEQRLNTMMEEAKAQIYIVDEKFTDKVRFNNENPIVVCMNSSEFSNEPMNNPNVQITPDNLMQILYTSGSTGKPKGILIPHRGWNNVLTWHFDTVSRGVNFLQFFSISTDSFFTEMFGALCSGATMVMIPEFMRFESKLLLEFIHDKKIPKVNIPVVLLQQWASDYGNMPQLFEHIRDICSTGEQLQITAPILSLFKQIKKCRLHNHYGPTETHAATGYIFPDDRSLWPLHAPIGKPFVNCSCYILNEAMQPVPYGVPGELYIGGVHLARGYLNVPAGSCKSFLYDPYSSDPTRRLYKTGDLVKYLSDGNLEYIERIDNIVKMRGFRIEIEEIEGVINQYPGISRCAVLMKGEIASAKYLVAYYTTLDRNPVDKQELHTHLRKYLYSYKIPSFFMHIESFPLSPNKKIDRKYLPDPEKYNNCLEDKLLSSKPKTKLEEDCIQIWSDVLKQPIGLEDNFFYFGGHSLLAVQLADKLGAFLKREIRVIHVIKNPTIGSFILSLQDNVASNRSDVAY